ncbi:hypothetical protein LWI28_005517 [Acer negundo]|uniref:WRKY domain-containing protein n=1 Tax=Acer negundo TaxID=4023 RepID=A0AAD5IXK3_ACENE|nr:hypothetical protein LWI28_005517 [Acer negundo]KAK4848087.1 hypothetical protein QYF36_009183 [Acer negundo]
MDMEQMVLISELTQGKELAKKLRNHLNPSSSKETRDSLIQQILGSYEKALSMLNCGGGGASSSMVDELADQFPSTFANISPRSDNSDLDYKDQCHKHVNKKRKTMPQWTEQMKVCSGTGLEGPLDDGYCWRKYGQKDILGANFPRGYYRCTHRHAQGCLATKQVQRSDEDPSIFEVTYRGRHTCSQNSQLAAVAVMASSSVPPPPAAAAALSKEKRNHQHYLIKQQEHEDQNQKQSQEVMMFNFGSAAGLKVKTENLDNREDIFPSFSFPLTSIEADNVEENMFIEPFIENDFMGSFSPKFISPATSESNYFSVSPSHNMYNFGLGHSVHTPESDLTEIISPPNSVTNSPIGEGFDFSLVKVDFDPNFPFDNLEFF